jgi:hypothetical protein
MTESEKEEYIYRFEVNIVELAHTIIFPKRESTLVGRSRKGVHFRTIDPTIRFYRIVK